LPLDWANAQVQQLQEQATLSAQKEKEAADAAHAEAQQQRQAAEQSSVRCEQVHVCFAGVCF